MEKSRQIELVKLLQSGDVSVADEFFRGIYNDVYYFALKTVKNEDLAADITQDTLIEVYSKVNTLNDPVAFPAWCRQITYHECTRYFRKKKDVLLEENEDGGSLFDIVEEEGAEFIPNEALDQKDFKQTVLQFIDTLSEEQRSAVLMYYFEELSVSQIAEIQGVSEGTVKSRLNYARKSIKSLVEDYEQKNGIKLHALPFFPFIKFLFSAEKATFSAPVASMQKAAVTISSAVSSATSATVATTAAVTATTSAVASSTVAATAVSSTVAATTSAVGIGAKIAAIPLALKIISGTVAAVLVIGGSTVLVDKLGDDIFLASNNNYSSSSDTSSKSDSSSGCSSNHIEEFVEGPLGIDEEKTFVSEGLMVKFTDTKTGDQYYKKMYLAVTFYPDGAELFNGVTLKNETFNGAVVQFDFSPTYDEYIPLNYTSYHKEIVDHAVEEFSKGFGYDVTWKEVFQLSKLVSGLIEYVTIDGVEYLVVEADIEGNKSSGPIYNVKRAEGSDTFTLTPLAVSKSEQTKLISLKIDPDSQEMIFEVVLPDGKRTTIRATSPDFLVSAKEN